MPVSSVDAVSRGDAAQGRFARFVANIRFNVYGQAVQAALPFFFIPFILRHLGKEAYSLYALIAVLTSQLNLLSFGAGPATVKYLAEFEAAEDPDRVNRLIDNSLLFYGAIGLFGTALILIFAPLLENRLLHIPPNLEPSAHFVFLCAAIVFLIQSAARTFHAIPQSLQRFDVWSALEAVTAIFLYAGIYFLLRGGWWLRGIAGWSISSAAFNFILYAVVGFRLLPYISLRPVYEQEMMRKIIGFGGWVFLGQVFWSIMFQMDKIVIGSYVPLADLTYYLIAFNLSQKLLVLLGPILPILLPLSSSLHGRDDYPTARKLYLSGTKIAMVLLWPATLLGIFFGPAFLEVWLGGHFSEHAGWVLRILLVGSFFNFMTSFGGLIAQGFGRVRTPTIIGVTTFTLGMASWFVVIPRYGIIGAAAVFLATMASNAVLLLTWCNWRLLSVPSRRFAGTLLPPIILSLPLIVLSFILRNSLKSWMTLGGYGFAAYGLFVASCYFFALDPEERKRFSALGI